MLLPLRPAAVSSGEWELLSVRDERITGSEQLTASDVPGRLGVQGGASAGALRFVESTHENTSFVLLDSEPSSPVLTIQAVDKKYEF
jgi:hypothetical protein